MLVKQKARLIKKYKDPEGSTDATLVVLAEETGIDDIFTLDHRGFRAYKLRGEKEFKLWPKLP